MKILGIDPATRTGWAIGEAGNTPILGSVHFGLHSEAHADILARAHIWFEQRLAEYRPDLVVIEAQIPAHQLKGKTSFSSLQLCHGIANTFTTLATVKGIPVRAIAISSWRAFAFGKISDPRPTRVQFKRAAIEKCKLLRWDASDDNAAEAGLIWLKGCSLVMPQLAHRPEPLWTGV